MSSCRSVPIGGTVVLVAVETVDPIGPLGTVVAMGLGDSSGCSVAARAGARVACGVSGVAGIACRVCVVARARSNAFEDALLYCMLPKTGPDYAIARSRANL